MSSGAPALPSLGPQPPFSPGPALPEAAAAARAGLSRGASPQRGPAPAAALPCAALPSPPRASGSGAVPAPCRQEGLRADGGLRERRRSPRDFSVSLEDRAVRCGTAGATGSRFFPLRWLWARVRLAASFRGGRRGSNGRVAEAGGAARSCACLPAAAACCARPAPCVCAGSGDGEDAEGSSVGSYGAERPGAGSETSAGDPPRCPVLLLRLKSASGAFSCWRAFCAGGPGVGFCVLSTSLLIYESLYFQGVCEVAVEVSSGTASEIAPTTQVWSGSGLGTTGFLLPFSTLSHRWGGTA